MQAQVITIAPDGTMSGLQVKPGKGVDLTKLGKANVVRASEIVWSEAKQLWNVHLLGSKRGLVGNLSLAMWQHAGLDHTHLPAETTAGNYEGAAGVLFFADYDLAVKAEIAYLDAMRLKGVL